MDSLFFLQEKADELRQLKINLISRFYPFTRQELLSYHYHLNFDRDFLMSNENVLWDDELIERFGEKLAWNSIFRINHSGIDFGFFEKYENLIDFGSIGYSRHIQWTQEIIDQYSNRFFEYKKSYFPRPLITVENLRKFRKKIRWQQFSRMCHLVSDQDVIIEFEKYWDWDYLSLNPNLNIDKFLYLKYRQKLNLNYLSMNPVCWNTIRNNPEWEGWNWRTAICNPSIKYDERTFEFNFYHYKIYREKSLRNSKFKIYDSEMMRDFISTVVTSGISDKSFFLKPEFSDYMPWKEISRIGNFKMPLFYIELHKEKIDFKSGNILRLHQDILTKEFVESNVDRFDFSDSGVYYLPITIELIGRRLKSLNWSALSNCSSLDWNVAFIEENWERLNHFRLAQNRGVYELFRKIIDPIQFLAMSN